MVIIHSVVRLGAVIGNIPISVLIGLGSKIPRHDNMVLTITWLQCMNGPFYICSKLYLLENNVFLCYYCGIYYASFYYKTKQLGLKRQEWEINIKWVRLSLNQVLLRYFICLYIHLTWRTGREGLVCSLYLLWQVFHHFILYWSDQCYMLQWL